MSSTTLIHFAYQTWYITVKKSQACNMYINDNSNTNYQWRSRVVIRVTMYSALYRKRQTKKVYDSISSLYYTFKYINRNKEKAYHWTTLLCCYFYLLLLRSLIKRIVYSYPCWYCNDPFVFSDWPQPHLSSYALYQSVSVVPKIRICQKKKDSWWIIDLEQKY